MADETLNDNGPDARVLLRAPDAHGAAALLLVESLLHAMTERAIITVAEAVEIVETAVEVTHETVAEVGPPVSHHESISLLEAISASLRHDL